MKRCIWILFLFLPFTVFAQTKTLTVETSSAKVYSNASATSEVLVTLKKGNKVDVVGVTEDGAWAKVKVVVSGFEFEGWMAPASFGKKTATKSSPTKSAKPAKKPVPTKKATPSDLSKASAQDLEKFFEPSNPEKPEPAAAPSGKAIDSAFEATPTRNTSKSGSSNRWIDERLRVYGVPGYSFLQYKFSDSLQDAFRYNLSGFSLQAGAEYRIIEFFKDVIHLRSQLNVQYSLLPTKTNLLDGSNVQFADLTALNQMLDIWFKLKVMVNFDALINKPFLIGVSAGYNFMKFFGDDIVDDTGVPVGLFVGQTISSIPVGVIAELHFLDPVELTLGADVLLANSASESPENSSGSQPEAKLGFMPHLYIALPVVGDEHHIGFLYRLRVQEVEFTGPSTPRVNTTLNNASSLTTIHTLGLEYAYHF